MRALRALAHLAASGTPADRETAKAISVGLDETLGRLEREVFPYLREGGTEIQFIHGANGRGKTHYLLAVEEAARRGGFVTARVECPMGQSPFRKNRGTYEMVATQLAPPPGLDSESISGVPSIVRAAVSPKARYSTKEVLASVKQSKHLAPEFRNLVLAYARGQADDGLSDAMIDDLEGLLMGSATQRVAISSLYKRDKTLPRPLGRITERNAAHWLRSLLSLPHALGYPGVIVMFDETERAFHGLASRGLQEQLAHLRNIVDYCALNAFAGCLILYAAADDFLDLARKELDALAQRIEPPSLLQGRFPSSARSVWTDLDDLTAPQTHDETFFLRLGEKVVGLGIECGLAGDSAARLRAKLVKESAAFARSPSSSIVRTFVKQAASNVLSEVNRRG